MRYILLLLAIVFTAINPVQAKHRSTHHTADTWIKATSHFESRQNHRAVNRISGAAGKHQFLASTWRVMIKKYGHKYGYSPRTSRFDPVASRRMALEYRGENRRYLTRRLGRMPSDGELYMAHLLGAGGAYSMITAPSHRLAKKVLPKAVRGNQAWFYTANGSPRTARQFRLYLNWRFDNAMLMASNQRY